VFIAVAWEVVWQERVCGVVNGVGLRVVVKR